MFNYFLFQFISGAVPSREIITKDLPVANSTEPQPKCIRINDPNQPKNSIKKEILSDSIKKETLPELPEISSSGTLVLADTDTYTITATFSPDVDKAQNDSHEMADLIKTSESNRELIEQKSVTEVNSDNSIDLDLEVTEEESDYKQFKYRKNM